MSEMIQTASEACSPIAESLCGDQGTIVMAAAYLDSHYQLDPGACNQQVAVPWAWLARFAAELTYQSATNALCVSKGIPYSVPSKHHFGGLHSQWCAVMTLANEGANEASIKSRCHAVSRYWQPIDAQDPGGLMLRYPLGHPNKSVPPIPKGFVEHCAWPLLSRQLIGAVCDATIRELSEASESCREALRYLRCSAAAGYCLGGYGSGWSSSNPSETKLLKRSVAQFG